MRVELRHRPWWFTGLLVLAIGVVYRRFLFGGEIFYSADQFPFFFAVHDYAWRTFHEQGTFSWWNPFLNLGTNLLGNPTRGLLYPLHLSEGILSTLVYYRWGWAAHLVLFGWGLRRWAKRAGAGESVAFALPILAATSAWAALFCDAGFDYLYAMTWTAWLMSEWRGRDGIAFSEGRLLAFWALLITNGEPFSLFLLGAGLAIWIAKERRWRLFIAFAGVSAVLGALVFGHGLLLLPYTTRSGGLGEAGSLAFSFHPWRLLTLLSPYFFGNPLHGDFDPGAVVNDSPYAPRFLFDTLFLSLPLLLACVQGLRHTAAKRRYGLVFLLLAGLLLAFGKWGPMLFFGHLFPFRYLRYPEKFLCVAGTLLVGLAFESDDPLAPLARGWLGPVIAGASFLLCLWTRSGDWPVGLLSASLLLLAGAHRRGHLSRNGLALGALLVGLAQNLGSQPPVHSLPVAALEKLSGSSRAILSVIPENSFRRFEVAPQLVSGQPPHWLLAWGTAMRFRRSSQYGYETFDTPLEAQIKARIWDGQQTLPPSEIEAWLQLTNLQGLVVRTDAPVTSLLVAAAAGAGVFRLATQGPGWALLEPVHTPHFAWWFPRLEERSSSGAESTLHWPPTVDPMRVFRRGIERAVSTRGLVSSGCAGAGAAPLPETAITRVSDGRLRFDFAAPCGGWIFLSQNLVPGWELESERGDVPLFAMNGSLLGFRVAGGRFQGELRYRPWAALARGLFHLDRIETTLARAVRAPFHNEPPALSESEAPTKAAPGRG